MSRGRTKQKCSKPTESFSKLQEFLGTRDTYKIVVMAAQNAAEENSKYLSY